MDAIPQAGEVPQDWATSFFDEGFEEVFALLGKFDTTESDIQDICELLELSPGDQVLDIPCGFGRHSAALSNRGVSVTGVDSSSFLIKCARTRHQEPDFIEGDLRNPPPKQFDAVINLWTSFGYLDSWQDDLLALRSWFGVLKPGGQLLMELTDRERAESENRKSNELESLKTTERNGVVECARFDWMTGQSYIRYTYKNWSRLCRSRIYSQEQLENMLRAVGFQQISIYGDFRKMAKRKSDRLVLLAKKE